MRRFELLLLIPLLLGADPYIVGSAADPDLVEEEETKFVDVIRIREHRYSEQFAVQAVTASPGGKEIAAVTRASRQGPRAWDVRNGRTVELPPMHTAVNAIAYDPAMRWVAVALQADVLEQVASGLIVFDLGSGKASEAMPGGDVAIDLAVSPDGGVIVGTDGTSVYAWDSKGSEPRPVLEGARGVVSVSFVNGDTVAVATDDGAAVQLVSLRDGRVAERFELKPGRAALAVSPEGRYVAVDHPRGIRIQDLWGSASQSQIVPIDGQVTALDWGQSGDLLVAGTADGRVVPFEVVGARGLASKGSTPMPDTAPAVVRAKPDEDPTEGRRKKESPLFESRPDVAAAFKVLVLDSFGNDPRSGGQLEKALRKNTKRLEPCWKKQNRKGNPVTGRLVFGMAISPEGEGLRIADPDPDGIGNLELTECLLERLKEPLFPAGLGNVDVELHIELSVAP